MLNFIQDIYISKKIFKEDYVMDYKADIAKFIVEVLQTILGFFNGTENELTEEQITGIENFVNMIFFL